MNSVCKNCGNPLINHEHSEICPGKRVGKSTCFAPAPDNIYSVTTNRILYALSTSKGWMYADEIACVLQLESGSRGVSVSIRPLIKDGVIRTKVNNGVYMYRTFGSAFGYYNRHGCRVLFLDMSVLFTDRSRYVNRLRASSIDTDSMLLIKNVCKDNNIGLLLSADTEDAGALYKDFLEKWVMDILYDRNQHSDYAILTTNSLKNTRLNRRTIKVNKKEGVTLNNIEHMLKTAYGIGFAF